jgi:predicted transcriptional regulator
MANPDPARTDPPADHEAFRAAVEAGKASLNAGRGISYEAVRRWLLSWGTGKDIPPPECP